jgi:two-component system OmpR family response regulator
VISQLPHILVVEDEEHLAIGIKYNLEAEGYRVTTAGDGPTALKTIADGGDAHGGDTDGGDTDGGDINGGVDLVVLDLMLPGMSGYEVCEKLRERGSDIPVLILSARTLSEDRTRGFDVGADQYLMKPFDLDELLSRVKGLLASYRRRTNAAAPPPVVSGPFEFGNARIDFDKFEVFVDGKLVSITKLEMTLLRYFIENKGRVIPRSELLENVWEMPASISTRAPDQFIRRLRLLFEEDASQPKHFITIRDAGYRFIAAPDGDK